MACIGWNRSSDKLLSLIDIRKNNGQKFNSAFHSSILIDKYTSQTTPFADPELKLIYTVAKEESYIKIFDYSSGTLKKYGDFKGTELNSFSIIFNRHLLNKQKNEIDRFARFTKKNNIFYISFILSNSQDFDGIIYPNEDLKKPQMNNEEWKNGKEIIPHKLYQKKPIQTLEVTNVDKSPLDNKEKRFPSNNKLRKDSSDNHKYLENFINKEANNNNNKKNKYPLNPQPKPFKNNPNNQQPVNYENLYKKLENDYIALVSEYKILESQLAESKNAFKAKINEEKNKYNLEINKYKNLINDINKKLGSSIEEINKLNNIIKERNSLIINNNSTIKNLESKIKNLENEIEVHTRENNNYKIQIEELNNIQKDSEELKKNQNNKLNEIIRKNEEIIRNYNEQLNSIYQEKLKLENQINNI
jgi:hypothetical protein